MKQHNLSMQNVLSNLKIDRLNEMQEAAIKGYKEHDNFILLSETGSGKTLAFLLPILETIEPANNKTQALIIVPSRELALQVEKVFKSMQTGLKIVCCYGGHLRETEENNLIQPPALIVGTAGRLADHIRRQNITTDTITSVVLDEFDKLLELGFQEELAYIVSCLPNLKSRMLTSATEADEIPAFLGFNNPVTLDFLTPENGKSKALTIQTVMASDKDKLETLFRLLCFIGSRSTIIFCNHREAVERTSDFLSSKGIVNVFYHGALEQQERETALSKFRNGSATFLVTTDLAARGLDIANIRYIIHYHLPQNEEIYIHRNGRTARMDLSGTAILVLSPEEKLPGYISDDVEQIELPDTLVLPEKPKWTTLFVAAGKKDKVNKVDIVGFLSNKGNLKKDDIGLIDVRDFFSFVAVRKTKVSETLQNIKNEKIKNKKVKIDVAR